MSAIQSKPPLLDRLELDDGASILESGDRLRRDEFERRYHAMPGVKKAELIDGIVYIPSPVRLKRHGRPHVLIVTWLGYYLAKTPGLEEFGDNATVRLDDDNEPQPDLLLCLPKSLGGRASVSEDDYLEGAAEFVAEVAASSVSIDTHLKLQVYRRHGVREYVIWRVEDKAVDWFSLREGRYEPLATDAEGLFRSDIFPGLWLDPAALIRGDLPRLFQVLDEAARTPEHAAFVQRLNAQKAP